MESKTSHLPRHTARHFLRFIISRFQVLATTIVLSSALVAAAAEAKITHSFLALGGETYMVSDTGKIEWTYPFSTRDGWVLAGGNLLLTLSKCDKYPGGGVVEVTRQGKVLFEYKGTQAEVNTSQKLPSGNILLTEAGPNPRIIEVDSKGTVVINIPLQCQTTNHHMQSRMTRKLANGNCRTPE